MQHAIALVGDPKPKKHNRVWRLWETAVRVYGSCFGGILGQLRVYGRAGRVCGAHIERCPPSSVGRAQDSYDACVGPIQRVILWSWVRAPRGAQTLSFSSSVPCTPCSELVHRNHVASLVKVEYMSRCFSAAAVLRNEWFCWSLGGCHSPNYVASSLARREGGRGELPTAANEWSWRVQTPAGVKAVAG